MIQVLVEVAGVSIVYFNIYGEKRGKKKEKGVQKC